MSAVPAASARPNVATSIAIVGVLFFLIGFFTWLNGPLITFVKLAFELSEVGAFLVLMVFYLSYFFLAQSVRRIAVGVAYAVWEGLGLTLLTVVGLTVFGESLSLQQLAGLVLAVVGIVCVTLGEAH